jgi:hypothetical protein
MFCLLTFAMGRQMSNPTLLSKKVASITGAARRIARTPSSSHRPVADKGNLPGDRPDTGLGR